MNRNLILYILAFIISVFSYQCHNAYPQEIPVSLNNSLQAYLKEKISEISAGELAHLRGEKIHAGNHLVQLYEYSDYQPFWNDPGRIEMALEGLNQSYRDGLLVDDYHVEKILDLIENLENEPSKEDALEYLAALDLLISDGIMFYAFHLLFGKIDPVTLDPSWNIGSERHAELDPEYFTEVINEGMLLGKLEQYRPHSPTYDTLRQTLHRYRKIANDGGWIPIAIGGKIEPGDEDARIPQIRRRLLMTGDLSDTTDIYNPLYDGSLEQDIRLFQRSYGLDSDGIIGKGTLGALSVSVEDRIDAIRTNMERTRWVSRNLPEDFIVVNIASFWLMVIENHERSYFCNVVVGKPFTQTPVFKSKMSYLELNPTWTVPVSIVRGEMIPKLRKDSTYLEMNHMVLLDGSGNIVPSSTLDFENLSSKNFPYTIRQEPGTWNALGVVKFLFPNKYSVYLHDTPSKSLFSKSSRAYSHGCIRVQDPLSLAEFLLRETEWNRQKLDNVVKSEKTTRINLPEPLDVLLIYRTAGLDMYNKLFFVPDIYNRDKDVLHRLNKKLD